MLSKILGIKTLEVITRTKPQFTLERILSLQDTVEFSLLDSISFESKSLMNNFQIGRNRHKIVENGARFINTQKFAIRVRYHQRENIIGFISRIKREKGILDFVRSIPKIGEKNPDMKFLIGGDGDLLSIVEEECQKIRKEHNIEVMVMGWIDDLPDCLNTLKLLVLPTYSDAFPTIILEAMACGTPVLSTSVGGIPDLIVDDETGFLLASNSSDDIAKGVERVVTNEHINDVISNARNTIESQYSYDSAITRFRSILEKTYQRKK